MKIDFFAILVLALAVLCPGRAGAQENGVPLIPTRHDHFAIPFEIKADGSDEVPKEIELIYSTDHGMSWFPYGRISPEKRQFYFQAPTDGEYWFLFKTYGRDGIANPNSRRNPMLRVLVDSIPPKLTVEAEQRSTGEVQLRWSIEDANLQKKYPGISISYYRPNKSDPSDWKTVAIDPLTVQTEGRKYSGEQIFWPERDAHSVEIRVEVVDIAGNRELQSRTVPLSAVGGTADSSLLTEEMQQKTVGLQSQFKQPTFRSPESYRNPAPKPASSAPGVPLTPPKPLILSESKGTPSNLREHGKSSDNPKAVVSAPAPRPLNETGRPPVLGLTETNRLAKADSSVQPNENRYSDSDLLSGISGSSVLPKFANPSYLDAAANVRSAEDRPSEPSVARSEVSLPEEKTDLMENSNRGAAEESFEPVPQFVETNPRYGSPKTETTPGETAAAPAIQSAVTQPAATQSASQSTAQQTSIVPARSTSMPQAAATKSTQPGKIVKVSLTTETQPPRIVVKWEIGDRTWAASKVHLYRGTGLHGPWEPIAVDQSNTGVYGWSITPTDRDPFFILVQCQRSPEEILSDTTAQPILLPGKLFD